jgi:hypothetical protein
MKLKFTKLKPYLWLFVLCVLSPLLGYLEDKVREIDEE